MQSAMLPQLSDVGSGSLDLRNLNSASADFRPNAYDAADHHLSPSMNFTEMKLLLPRVPEHLLLGRKEDKSTED
eukprot:CAMPEP_0197065032 /NCGR_PEP_ID=MMETSP1384-20130603/163974_1 /TAXON_ID=29189 /ORGANISM="Ammonia sp." /LENGTH=73 /DNA_ID=CAMNT_0042501751 /DNA_START=1 /DNA_END=222 /DNA_ORIENTATION=-